ncbi:MAG TPA: TlpA disulfide reductase family protein [Salinimicrobium sp.]|nr:TlpA disulfide reductase family protein [Salinimicrobium sp.]
MNKKAKINLIEFGAIGAIILTLFVTGLHTEVLGFLQRGILETGMLNPDLEKKAELAVNDSKSKADFNMTLVNSKGETVNMDEFRGKVIFMNIWATWCPPCIAEMPGINNLYNDVKEKDVTFIMISVDQNFQKAIDFAEEKGYDFEIYKVQGTMPRMYATRAIPTTYVIGADQTLALTHKGMGDYDTAEFKSFLQNLK